MVKVVRFLTLLPLLGLHLATLIMIQALLLVAVMMTIILLMIALMGHSKTIMVIATADPLAIMIPRGILMIVVHDFVFP